MELKPRGDGCTWQLTWCKEQRTNVIAGHRFGVLSCRRPPESTGDLYRTGDSSRAKFRKCVVRLSLTREGTVADMSSFTFYEFFAGGGMARAGLGAGWACVFANDFDPMKTATYVANWGDGHIICEDVAKISTSSLPGKVDLAWASFPCQDLSLAGDYAGLGRSASPTMTRSGTFWPFW